MEQIPSEQSIVKELKFVQSKTDECVLYRGSTMDVLYTDDSILAGPDETEINQIIKEMKQVKLDITVEGGLEDFLGINIDRQKDGTINLTQPHLIDQILKDLRLEDENVKRYPKQVKLDITVEGGLEDFLGINIDRQKDGTINLTQPHLA
jgi:hypothetical protein